MIRHRQTRPPQVRTWQSRRLHRQISNQVKTQAEGMSFCLFYLCRKICETTEVSMTKIILICAAIFVIADVAGGQCSDAEKKTLEALDRAWSKAGLSGDKAALTNIYAEDYVGFPEMDNKTAAINDTMSTFQRNKANPAGANKVTYDHYRISCTPVSATITHRNTVWTPNGEGGKPETFYARSVHVLEKRGGKWQV